MDLLLELMQKTTYRDASGTTRRDWRGPRDWARSLFGGRNTTMAAEKQTQRWLEEMAADGEIQSEDQGEGITLYRAEVN